MASDDEQIRVRAAWLYYMEGLTQAEIADRLKMTRLRANRLLMEARASGLVSITLTSRLESCVRLEQELVATCGLREAVVVPTPSDDGLVPALVGRATGEFISRFLEEEEVSGFGVGWGATLRETIRNVRPGSRPGMRVTSMMGGLTYGIELNTFEIASELARRWNAECHYLAAPIYAGTPQSRDTIVAQDVFEEAFARIRATDVAVLSVGDLTDRSLLVRYGLPRDVNIAELEAAGAVGDITGQFVDQSGRPIAHPINARAIALPLDELAKIPTVVLASGGINKARIIAAMLRARIAAVLVTDEQTAAAALDIVRRP
ncbi:sugar-binding transcriptional regulator [Chelatococcus sp. GCM10030263]|uniref:sugar-binding transcriptional regulator n=1 Tax=Chelatococcus sp. GCM10030263 TaxID=3273387 RepID=UPI003623D0C0